MRKTLLAGIAISGALLLGIVQASAAPIVGQLSINGQDTFTSSAVTFIGNGNVGPGTATGSYAPIFGIGCTNCVTETGFTYNVLGAISPVNVYSVSLGAGPTTATFTINDIVSESNTGGFLNVLATGFANLSGFDQTAGSFLFSSQGTGMVVTTFSATTTATPEPLSLAVLGTGLAGLGLIRRRRSV